jgi:hypothetical protein
MLQLDCLSSTGQHHGEQAVSVGVRNVTAWLFVFDLQKFPTERCAEQSKRTADLHRADPGKAENPYGQIRGARLVHCDLLSSTPVRSLRPDRCQI